MSLQITTNITDEKKAIAVLGEVVKNPPKDPLDVLKFAAKHFSVSGSVTDAIAKYFPSISGLIPIAGQIFEMFSGLSGPSIGQLTLDAIQQVSEQLAAGIQDLKNTMRFESERVIDLVSQATAQVSQEESATRIINSIYEASVLAENDLKKEQIFEEFQSTISQARQQFMDDAKKAIADSQDRVNKSYAQMQALLASQALQIMTDIYNQLNVGQSESPTQSRSAPASVSQNLIPNEEKQGVNPLIFAPLLLLLFAKKKK